MAIISKGQSVTRVSGQALEAFLHEELSLKEKAMFNMKGALKDANHLREDISNFRETKDLQNLEDNLTT